MLQLASGISGPSDHGCPRRLVSDVQPATGLTAAARLGLCEQGLSKAVRTLRRYMGCLFAVFAGAFPRFAVVLMWLARPEWFLAASLDVRQQRCDVVCQRIRIEIVVERVVAPLRVKADLHVII